MFQGFGQRSDVQRRRRFIVAAGAAAALYVGVGALALALTSKREVALEDSVDVSFTPAPEEKKAPPPAVVIPLAPVPEGMKVKRVASPRAPTPMVAPTEIPDAKPDEADAKKDVVEVGEGGGGGDPAGIGAGTPATAAPATSAPETAAPPPPPPPRKRDDPINLPESGTPPVADAGNTAPEYPEAARTAGLEGQVILKVVVTESGDVTDVQVLRGDEPFVSAAVAAVKGWHYSPALVDGKATAVFRIVKIPFRLKT